MHKPDIISMVGRIERKERDMETLRIVFVDSVLSAALLFSCFILFNSLYLSETASLSGDATFDY